MILSIIMIVKNEEKYLDKCLGALKNILDKLDSELIIVDTGSVDNTVNIAKKYTDKVFNFEWCDDFAKARNASLDKSSGDWILYIDADEIFESTDEIIDFFKSNKCYKFATCAYTIRNYQNYDGTRYSDMISPRIVKKYKELQFTGIVHESLQFKEPVLYLNKTLCHHYGYNFDDNELKEKKCLRNILLLEKKTKIETNNAQTYFQLAQIYLINDKVSKALNNYNRALEIAKNDNKKSLLYAVYGDKISLYTRYNNNIEAKKEIEEYFSVKENTILTDIDIFYYDSVLDYRLEQYEDCIKSYVKYMNLMHQYKNGKLFTSEISNRPLYTANKPSEYDLKIIVAKAYIQLGKYEESYDVIKSDIFVNCEDTNFDERLVIEFNIMAHYNNYERFVYLYSQVINDELRLSKLQNYIEKIIVEVSEIKEAIINAFKNSEDSTIVGDSYVELMKLRAENSNNNLSNKKIISLVSNLDIIDEKYADMVYFIIKQKLPFSILKNKINVDQISRYIKIISLHYNDYINIIMNYDYIVTDIYDLICYIYTLEELLNDICSDGLDRFMKIYNIYTQYIEQYILQVYNQDVLNESNVFIINKQLRFGYYCLLANQSLKYGDKVKCINLLHMALEENQSNNGIISVLLDNLDKNDDADEFQMLAQTVKNNINFLINSGQIEDAKVLLTEYKKINPYDEDIYVIENKID